MNNEIDNKIKLIIDNKLSREEINSYISRIESIRKREIEPFEKDWECESDNVWDTI